MENIKSFLSSYKWWLVACLACAGVGALVERRTASPEVRVEERVVEKVVEKIVEVESKQSHDKEKTVVEHGPRKTTKKEFKDGKVVKETVVEEGGSKKVSEKESDSASSKSKQVDKTTDTVRETSVVTSPRPSWSLGASVPASSVRDRRVQQFTVEGGYRFVGPVWVTLSGVASTSRIEPPGIGLGLRVEF